MCRRNGCVIIRDLDEIFRVSLPGHDPETIAAGYDGGTGSVDEDVGADGAGCEEDVLGTVEVYAVGATEEEFDTFPEADVSG